MPGGVGHAGPLWAWPDALFAAVFAVCLVVLVVLVAARAGRVSAVGPAVAAALVLALSGALVSHGLTAVRIVVAAVLAGAAVLAVAATLTRRRRARGTPARRRNEIASPIRR